MYNIKAVSKLLGMPAVTIRSWETRYQAIEPERTESGHRVYTEENVKDLKWLKKQVQENGMKVSQAVQQLHGMKDMQEGPANKEHADFGEKYEKQIADIFQAVEDMDEARCHMLLDLCFSQFHYRTVFYSIIVPLMYRVGDAWEKGEIHVAQEHMITNIVLQRFTNFFRIFETSPTLPKVMALCPSGEQHQVGLLLFTLYLKESGYPVLYIGADTPLEGLDKLIERKGVDIVAISTSRKENDPVVRKYIRQLTKAVPDLRFIIGGTGVEQGLAMEDICWTISSDSERWPKLLAEINKSF